MPNHAEVCYSGDNTKTTYAHENQPNTLYSELKKAFPWVMKAQYFSISEATYHEVLQEPVITCCIPLTQAIQLLGDQTALGARKFCMESKTSFLRTYEVFDEERPQWAPESAQFLFIGRNKAEFRRPFPEIAGQFVDIYFSGDADDVESTLGLPELRGQESTWYGVTVLNGEIVRSKQYCYDEAGTASDWRAAYDSHMQRIGAI